MDRGVLPKEPLINPRDSASRRAVRDWRRRHDAGSALPGRFRRVQGPRLRSRSRCGRTDPLGQQSPPGDVQVGQRGLRVGP